MAKVPKWINLDLIKSDDDLYAMFMAHNTRLVISIRTQEYICRIKKNLNNLLIVDISGVFTILSKTAIEEIELV